MAERRREVPRLHELHDGLPDLLLQLERGGPDLTGKTVERWRRWDSCFNSAFSELHHAPVRKTTAARYRQWLTHKLASWYDQFDTSGCVGCGRCITWCPVGIDITEEVAVIRATPGKAAAAEARS